MFNFFLKGVWAQIVKFLLFKHLFTRICFFVILFKDLETIMETYSLMKSMNILAIWRLEFIDIFPEPRTYEPMMLGFENIRTFIL